MRELLNSVLRANGLLDEYRSIKGPNRAARRREFVAKHLPRNSRKRREALARKHHHPRHER